MGSGSRLTPRPHFRSKYMTNYCCSAVVTIELYLKNDTGFFSWSDYLYVISKIRAASAEPFLVIFILNAEKIMPSCSHTKYLLCPSATIPFLQYPLKYVQLTRTFSLGHAETMSGECSNMHVCVVNTNFWQFLCLDAGKNMQITSVFIYFQLASNFLSLLFRKMFL